MKEEKTICLGLNVNSFKEKDRKYAIEDIKSRITNCMEWVERIEKVDENKTDFENISNAVDNIDWLQREVMGLHSIILDFNRKVVGAQTFAIVNEVGFKE